MSSLPPVSSVVSDSTTHALQQALRGLSARQRVIAANVSNVETPGYLAQTVSFEDSLAGAIADGDPAAMRVAQDSSLAPTRMNGNNVNLDVEIASQVETNLRQQLAVRALNAKYAMVRNVLQVA